MMKFGALKNFNKYDEFSRRHGRPTLRSEQVARELRQAIREMPIKGSGLNADEQARMRQALVALIEPQALKVARFVVGDL